jgi:glucose-6-phosphate 1-dehydrogenase
MERTRAFESLHQMAKTKSDALVFFGATGDLAYKQIFPALQAMAKRGLLELPIVGVAKSDWNLDQLRKHARESLEHHGGVDNVGWEKLSAKLKYVDGDYREDSTYKALRAVFCLSPLQHGSDSCRDARTPPVGTTGPAARVPLSSIPPRLSAG